MHIVNQIQKAWPQKGFRKHDCSNLCRKKRHHRLLSIVVHCWQYVPYVVPDIPIPSCNFASEVKTLHYTQRPQYFFHLRAITLIQLIVWDLKYVFHWKQWSELRNVDTFTRSKPFTRRKARRHCVTGAVLTHDAMNTGFYFWKPTTSALYKKVG